MKFIMALFTEIKCVKKNGPLIVQIYGTVAPSSSDGVPTEGTIRATDDTQGVNEYLFPDGRRKLIRYITMNETNCFFLEGDEIGKNFLEAFPEC